MKNRIRLALLAGLLWAGCAQAQHDCAVGAISGGRNPKGDPEQAQACVLMGRMFCHVAQIRNKEAPAEHAVSDTTGWLQRMNQTGSHLARIDFRPMVEGVAQYVYAHPVQASWTSYYYGVYTCGVDQRTPAGPSKAAAMQDWETRAQECERKFPAGADQGYVNDPLRACLMDAMKSVAAAGK